MVIYTTEQARGIMLPIVNLYLGSEIKVMKGVQ